MAQRIVISKTSIYLGEAVEVAVHGRETGLTYTLTLNIGYDSYVLKRDYNGDAFMWTPPYEWAEYIQNSDRMTCQLVCKSVRWIDDFFYEDVGSTQISITLIVPDQMGPTVTMTVTDPTGWYNSIGSFIEAVSTVHVTTSSTPAYGARIVSTEIRCCGVVQTKSTADFEVKRPFPDGVMTVTCVVTDARGYTGTATRSFPAIEYNLPASRITDLYRCDVNGNEDPQGAYAKILYTGLVDAIAVNGATYEIRYRKRGTNSWTAVPLPEHNGKNNISSTILIAAAANDAYDFCIRTDDRFTKDNDSPYRVCPVAFVLMDFNNVTKSVGIGQAATKENTLLIGLLLQLNSGIALQPQSTNWSSIGNYLDSLLECSSGVQFFSVRIGGTTYVGTLLKMSSTEARADLFSTTSHSYIIKRTNWGDRVTNNY